MTSIGFPPPSARFPILSETTRPEKANPDSVRTAGVAPADRPAQPERPTRPDHPHRTDRPARPDRPAHPGEIDQRGRSHLAHATRRFVHEAQAIMKGGGTMEDVEALANKILEKIPAIKKFPPFQKLLTRIAYNIENGGPPSVDPTPNDPNVPVAAKPLAGLAGGEPGDDATEITVPPSGVSIVV